MKKSIYIQKRVNGGYLVNLEIFIGEKSVVTFVECLEIVRQFKKSFPALTQNEINEMTVYTENAGFAPDGCYITVPNITIKEKFLEGWDTYEFDKKLFPKENRYIEIFPTKEPNKKPTLPPIEFCEKCGSVCDRIGKCINCFHKNF